MDEAQMLGDEYCIGEFGDKRLCKTGKLLYGRMRETGHGLHSPFGRQPCHAEAIRPLAGASRRDPSGNHPPW